MSRLPTTRATEFLGSWIVVGLLALALVGVWGVNIDGTASYADPRGALCGDRIVAGASVPRGDTWSPDPVLSGIPQKPEDASDHYDLTEERLLAQWEPQARSDDQVMTAQGSSTSLNPIRMC